VKEGKQALARDLQMKALPGSNIQCGLRAAFFQHPRSYQDIHGSLEVTSLQEASLRNGVTTGVPQRGNGGGHGSPGLARGHPGVEAAEVAFPHGCQLAGHAAWLPAGRARRPPTVTASHQCRSSEKRVLGAVGLRGVGECTW